MSIYTDDRYNPKKHEVCSVCRGDGYTYGISGAFSHDCMFCRGSGYNDRKGKT
jgi:DnaJ-class molecular chaperone